MFKPDAFELSKYNSIDLINMLIGEKMIISYGYIDAIDYDTVSVTLMVSDKTMAERVRCKFMNLGSELFSINVQPQTNMRVLVFAPQKGADQMFDANNQLTATDGRGYIMTGSPAIYSSQFAFCLPLAPDLLSALNSVSINSGTVTTKTENQIVSEFYNSVESTYETDTNTYYQAGNHIRGYYGTKWEEFFGFEEGLDGLELEGHYAFLKTYGKWSQVALNYESGFTMTIGKAYQTPFAPDKGELEDVAAPVTVQVGTLAPVSFETGSEITITLKGDAKFNIIAEEGTFSFANSATSLKDILLKISELYQAIATIGGPASQKLDPALVQQAASELDNGLLKDFFGE